VIFLKISRRKTGGGRRPESAKLTKHLRPKIFFPLPPSDRVHIHVLKIQQKRREMELSDAWDITPLPTSCIQLPYNLPLIRKETSLLLSPRTSCLNLFLSFHTLNFTAALSPTSMLSKSPSLVSTMVLAVLAG